MALSLSALLILSCSFSFVAGQDDECLEDGECVAGELLDVEDGVTDIDQCSKVRIERALGFPYTVQYFVYREWGRANS